MATKIGVDMGGSWIRVGVLEPGPGGGTLRVEKHPSPGSWERFVAVMQNYNRPDVEGVGVAVAGPIEDHAVVLQGPNLPWLSGRDVRRELGGLLGKKVVVSNDMEAAAEGEMARGVLRGLSWAIFDTLSTGWGGALIVNGKRVDSEPGHANIRFDSPYRCGCGNFGCYEAHYSGSAMQRRIREQVPDLPAEASAWDAFHAAVAAGTPWAIALRDDWAEGVGRAWANALNRVRPLQAIVYMGTTAEQMLAQPAVAERLRGTIARIAIFPEHRAAAFPILRATEPDRAIWGAIAVYDQVA